MRPVAGQQVLPGGSPGLDPQPCRAPPRWPTPKPWAAPRPRSWGSPDPRPSRPGRRHRAGRFPAVTSTTGPDSRGADTGTEGCTTRVSFTGDSNRTALATYAPDADGGCQTSTPRPPLVSATTPRIGSPPPATTMTGSAAPPPSPKRHRNAADGLAGDLTVTYAATHGRQPAQTIASPDTGLAQVRKQVFSLDGLTGHPRSRATPTPSNSSKPQPRQRPDSPPGPNKPADAPPPDPPGTGTPLIWPVASRSTSTTPAPPSSNSPTCTATSSPPPPSASRSTPTPNQRIATHRQPAAAAGRLARHPPTRHLSRRRTHPHGRPPLRPHHRTLPHHRPHPRRQRQQIPTPQTPSTNSTSMDAVGSAQWRTGLAW